MSTAFHLLCLGIFATTVLLSPACGAMAPSPAQPYSDGLRISQPEYVKTNNSVDTGQAMPQDTAGRVSPEQARILKPGYHITPSTGWMNDPNGMFQSAAGIYHVFFQWNPNAPIWGAPYWGHVISTDMVHWERLPPALIPDTEYDYDGVFSGSATLLDDGSPVLFYTGVSNFSTLKYYSQVQATARPVNASDPRLQLWIKTPINPLISQAPTSGSLAQFRDPVSAWKQDGLWYTVIGAMESCMGSAALYSSTDFKTWQPAGTWASQATLGMATNSQCTPPALPQPGIGQCDQFGDVCRMWECPDVFDLSSGTWALKWSDQSKTRKPFSMDWYVLGTFASFLGNQSNANISSGGEGFFQTTVQSAPQSVDYGSIYASKSFKVRDGRRILFGWVFETAAGCVEQCSAGINFTDSLGWQGAQTLPREITLDEASRALMMNPVKEVETLRTQLLYNSSALSLPADFSNGGLTDLNLTRSSSLGRQMEIQAAHAVDRAAGNSSQQQLFTVGMRMSTGGDSYTSIIINGTAAAGANGSLTIGQAGVYVDRSHSGAYTNRTVQGGAIPLPPTGLQAISIPLRVFVDRSLLEVYALDGRGRVTSRIYPMGVSNTWGVSIFGSLGSTAISSAVSVWELGNAFNASMANACC